jgi:hypothetical protein
MSDLDALGVLTASAFTRLTDAQVLGLTGAGEARSELVPGKGWQPAPLEDMIAVMWTPVNRVAADAKRFGADVSDACFEQNQYSCWNPRSGSNHDWLISQATAILSGRSVAPVVRSCIAEAEKILAEGLPAPIDPTSGATHYYSPKSMIPPGRVPVWARGHVPVARIGDQIFFKGV